MLTSLLIAVVPLRLVKDFRAWARKAAPGSAPTLAMISEWLIGRERAEPAIAPAVGRAFADAYASGWLVGRDTAEMLLGRREHGDWSFSPNGYRSFAREILHERGDGGPRRLFEGDGRAFMRKAVHGRADILARALADTAEQTSGRASVAVRNALADRNWAQGLSQTEVTRAVSAATLDSYRRDGVPSKEWMTALDQYVCKICRGNELAGPIGLDEEFPSGDTHPPGHPGGCRCGLLPAYRDRQ